MLLLSFFLTLIGAVLPLMRFEFLGIAGLAINLVDTQLGETKHSLVSIATAIVDGSDDDPATRLGIIFLQTCYLLFALVIAYMVGMPRLGGRLFQRLFGVAPQR